MLIKEVRKLHEKDCLVSMRFRKLEFINTKETTTVSRMLGSTGSSFKLPKKLNNGFDKKRSYKEILERFNKELKEQAH